MTTPEHIRLQQVGWLARVALALVFFWHGLVPKLLWLSADEVAMIQAHGIVEVEWLAALAGFAEIALAVLILSIRRHWPVLLAALLLILLLVDVALLSPHLLVQAFNPVSTNLAALALCLVAWLAESTPVGRANLE